VAPGRNNPSALVAQALPGADIDDLDLKSVALGKGA
jgi:hypothetical protein